MAVSNPCRLAKWCRGAVWLTPRSAARARRLRNSTPSLPMTWMARSRTARRRSPWWYASITSRHSGNLPMERSRRRTVGRPRGIWLTDRDDGPDADERRRDRQLRRVHAARALIGRRGRASRCAGGRGPLAASDDGRPFRPGAPAADLPRSAPSDACGGSGRGRRRRVHLPGGGLEPAEFVTPCCVRCDRAGVWGRTSGSVPGLGRRRVLAELGQGSFVCWPPLLSEVTSPARHGIGMQWRGDFGRVRSSATRLSASPRRGPGISAAASGFPTANVPPRPGWRSATGCTAGWRPGSTG